MVRLGIELFLVHMILKMLRLQLDAIRKDRQLTSANPAPTSPAPSAPAGGTPATLQEALAEEQAGVAATGPPWAVSEGQLLADLVSVRDCYFGGLGLLDQTTGEMLPRGRQTWIAMLQKRGLPGSALPVGDVAREMIATLTAKVEERRQALQNSGVAVATEGGPSRTGGAKS